MTTPPDNKPLWQVKRDELAGIYECDKQHPERKFYEDGYKYRDFQAGYDAGRVDALAEIEMLRDENKLLHSVNRKLANHNADYKAALAAKELELERRANSMKEQGQRIDHLEKENHALRAQLDEAKELLQAFAGFPKKEQLESLIKGHMEAMRPLLEEWSKTK